MIDHISKGEITMAANTNEIKERKLTVQELDQIAGGHPFEDCFWDEDLYRAGVSYYNTVFGDDEYYIGSTRISKDLARLLREKSKNVWRKYAASGDYLNYAREWKALLANQYNIDWDGQIGTYKFQVC